MIATADVKDQELSVRSIGGRIDHPPIARRNDLGPLPGRDRGSLFGPSLSVGSTEFTYPDTAGRQRQLAFGGNKGNCGPHSGWILESRKTGSCFPGRL